MEGIREETVLEEVKPREEAGVATDGGPSPLHKAILRGGERRASAPFFRKRGRSLLTSKLFLSGLATAAILVVGITVVLLQNKARMRSGKSLESPRRYRAGSASKQVSGPTESRCMAIFTAQEALFLSKEGNEVDSEGGPAPRRLAEGEGPEEEAGPARSSSEEELICVVRRVLRGGSVEGSGGIALTPPRSPALPLPPEVEVSEAGYPTAREMIQGLATQMGAEEDDVALMLGDLLKKYPDRYPTEVVYLLFREDLKVQAVQDFLDKLGPTYSVDRREIHRCKYHRVGFVRMPASAQRNLAWSVGVALSGCPAPKLEPSPRLGDPTEMLDAGSDGESLFRLLSLYATGSISHATKFRLGLVSFMEQHYWRRPDMRSHLSVEELRRIEQHERISRRYVSADVGVPHRFTPVEELDIKALLEARTHRLLIESLVPTPSKFEMQALADAFGLTIWTYTVPEHDGASGLMMYGAWERTDPVLLRQRTLSRKMCPIYFSTSKGGGGYSLVSRVSEPFMNSIHRAEILEQADRIRADRARAGGERQLERAAEGQGDTVPPSDPSLS